MDHGGCGLLVRIEDNQILEIKGDPQGHANAGYTCYKGRAAADRLNHPNRLRQPLKRVGTRGAGQWQTISWDAALDETACQLLKIKDEYGARAVAFGVGMPKGLDHFVLIRLANLFGSPNVVASQDVCHAPREITGLHTCGFYPVADLHHPTSLLIVWGSNPLLTNEEGQIGCLALRQLKSGARLMVVDPYRTVLADRADLWLQLKPGTSAALALGLIHVIIEEGLFDHGFTEQFTFGFDDLARQVQPFSPELVSTITWVDADLIRRAARLYAGAKPAALQWGNAIEHSVHTFDAARALVCLMAITGNLEVPGGNINPHEPEIMGLGEFVRADLLPGKSKEMIGAFHRVIPRMMTVPPAYFRKTVLEGDPYPVRGYYGMCTNPMVTWADSRTTHETFTRLDFSVVTDLYMTPTAAMADIVLPAASQFEFNDIGHYGLGHGIIFARPKLVDPPGACRPDLDILNDLGKRISDPSNWHADFETFLSDVLKPSGVTYSEFAEKGFLKGPEKFQLYLNKGFRTTTGKVELRLSTAEKFNLPPLPSFSTEPSMEDPDYPLLLTSSKNPHYLHSSYRWMPKLRSKAPHPTVEIHPSTASRQGIEPGDQVIIATRHGCITQTAQLTDRVHPGVIRASIGWWFPEGEACTQFDWQTANFNMLTSIEPLGREFGTPNLKGIPCQILKG